MGNTVPQTQQFISPSKRSQSVMIRDRRNSCRSNSSASSKNRTYYLRGLGPEDTRRKLQFGSPRFRQQDNGIPQETRSFSPAKSDFKIKLMTPSLNHSNSNSSNLKGVFGLRTQSSLDHNINGLSMQAFLLRNQSQKVEDPHQFKKQKIQTASFKQGEKEYAFNYIVTDEKDEYGSKKSVRIEIHDPDHFSPLKQGVNGGEQNKIKIEENQYLDSQEDELNKLMGGRNSGDGLPQRNKKQPKQRELSLEKLQQVRENAYAFNNNNQEEEGSQNYNNSQKDTEGNQKASDYGSSRNVNGGGLNKNTHGSKGSPNGKQSKRDSNNFQHKSYDKHGGIHTGQDEDYVKGGRRDSPTKKISSNSKGSESLVDNRSIKQRSPQKKGSGPETSKRGSGLKQSTQEVVFDDLDKDMSGKTPKEVENPNKDWNQRPSQGSSDSMGQSNGSKSTPKKNPHEMLYRQESRDNNEEVMITDQSQDEDFTSKSPQKNQIKNMQSPGLSKRAQGSKKSLNGIEGGTHGVRTLNQRKSTQNSLSNNKIGMKNASSGKKGLQRKDTNDNNQETKQHQDSRNNKGGLQGSGKKQSTKDRKISEGEDSKQGFVNLKNQIGNQSIKNLSNGSSQEQYGLTNQKESSGKLFFSNGSENGEQDSDKDGDYYKSSNGTFQGPSQHSSSKLNGKDLTDNGLHGKGSQGQGNREKRHTVNDNIYGSGKKKSGKQFLNEIEENEQKDSRNAKKEYQEGLSEENKVQNIYQKSTRGSIKGSGSMRSSLQNPSHKTKSSNKSPLKNKVSSPIKAQHNIQYYENGVPNQSSQKQRNTDSNASDNNSDIISHNKNNVPFYIKTKKDSSSGQGIIQDFNDSKTQPYKKISNSSTSKQLRNNHLEPNRNKSKRSQPRQSTDQKDGNNSDEELKMFSQGQYSYHDEETLLKLGSGVTGTHKYSSGNEPGSNPYNRQRKSSNVVCQVMADGNEDDLHNEDGNFTDNDQALHNSAKKGLSGKKSSASSKLSNRMLQNSASSLYKKKAGSPLQKNKGFHAKKNSNHVNEYTQNLFNDIIEEDLEGGVKKNKKVKPIQGFNTNKNGYKGGYKGSGLNTGRPGTNSQLDDGSYRDELRSKQMSSKLSNNEMQQIYFSNQDSQMNTGNSSLPAQKKDSRKELFEKLKQMEGLRSQNQSLAPYQMSPKTRTAQASVRNNMTPRSMIKGLESLRSPLSKTKKKSSVMSASGNPAFDKASYDPRKKLDSISNPNKKQSKKAGGSSPQSKNMSPKKNPIIDLGDFNNPSNNQSFSQAVDADKNGKNDIFFTKKGFNHQRASDSPGKLSAFQTRQNLVNFSKNMNSGSMLVPSHQLKLERQSKSKQDDHFNKRLASNPNIKVRLSSNNLLNVHNNLNLDGQTTFHKNKKSCISEYFGGQDIVDLFGGEDPVGMQGDLFRFKPGVEKNFIQRYVQVSGRAFRYFRNKYQSLAGMSRPIVSIPNAAIEDVCKIKIKKEPFLCKRDMDENEKMLFDHMFEIYLKEDYEDVYVFRDEEVKVQEEVRRSQSRARSARPTNNQDNSFTKLSRLNLNLDMSKLLNKSINYNRPASTRSLGRISRFNETPYEKLVRKNKQEQREAPKLTRVGSTFLKNHQEREASQSKINRVVQGHLVAVRDQNKGAMKNAYLEDQAILNKEFGMKKEKPDQAKVAAWSTRVMDWYNSERRIIFACTSEKDRNRWVNYFREKAMQTKFKYPGLESDNDIDSISANEPDFQGIEDEAL